MNNRRAYTYLLASFVLWGFFPLYFYAMRRVRADEILAARIIFAAFSMILLFAFLGKLKKAILFLADKYVLKVAAICALLISGNWYLYIWMVQNDMTLEASLGYFVTPIFNLLIGMFFFGERLNFWQWLGVVFAALGIIYQLFFLHAIPWMALLLGLAFACYGGIRKKFPLPALEGLFSEMALLTPLAIIFYLALNINGLSYDYHQQLPLLILVLTTGIVTVLPLFFYLQAVKYLPFTAVAFAQFFTPSVQFIIAVFYFHEPFDKHRLISFILIWIGLLFYPTARKTSPIKEKT